MPFAYPSHAGLVAPLWRRWPHLFDMPAMCVGAVMPDVVDGLIGAYRGHLGQTLGHSFIGVALFCVPGGVVVWWLFYRAMQRIPHTDKAHILARGWNMSKNAVLAVPGPCAIRQRWKIVLVSLTVGALSHLVFDVLSHGKCPWFLPWMGKFHVFPAWWEHVWFRMPIPGYKNGYPFAPHFIAWCAFGVLGGYLLWQPFIHSERGKASQD